MTLQRFQAQLMRLVVDTSFREAAAADPVAILGDSELTPRERQRLVAVTRSKGLGITVLLHRGWRLGKLLSLLPATCSLLGPDELARVLGTFWRDRLPDSLYFHEEALAFADHLAECDELLAQTPGLREVLALERVRLERGRWMEGASPGSH